MKLKIALFMNLLLVAMLAGLHFGGMVYYNSGLDTLPQTTLITAQQHIEKAFAPSIAWFFVITALSALPAIYFAWKAKSRLLPYIVIGGICVAAGVISTIIVNVPINHDMLKWSAVNPPSDWLAVRHRWDVYNDFRTVAFVLGFSVLLAGIIFEPSIKTKTSRKTHNQKGFSAVIALLFLILITMIGFTGYYVWHSKNQADKNYNQAANTNISSQISSGPEMYLEISEYKIKVHLSAAISDAYYVNVKNSIGFSVHSLNYSKTTPDCDPQKATVGSDGIASGGVAQLNWDLNNASGRSVEQHAQAHESKINNNYFSISGNDGCKSNDQATEAKIKTIQQAFEAAGSHIIAL